MTNNTDFADPLRNSETETRYLRLKQAVEAAGGNALVAGKAEIGTTTLSTYMNGQEWKFSIIEKIAHACGVDLRWLFFGDGSAPQPKSAPASEEVNIRFYDEAEASAGFGLNGIDGPVAKHIPVSRIFLEELGLKPHHTVILKARGDSMEPTLKTGDHLFLDTTQSSMLSGVHVFTLNGLLMVKRLAATASGTVRISSDNALYPSEEVPIGRLRWGQPDGNDSITIIGRVAYRLQALS